MPKQPEEIFVDNLRKSLDSYSFQPNRIGSYVNDLSVEEMERLAETMLYIIDSWETSWRYNDSMLPKHIAEFGHFLSLGLAMWLQQSDTPQRRIMKTRAEFLNRVNEN